MSVNTSTTSIKTSFVPRSNGVADEVYYPSTIPNYLPENNIHFVLIANLVLMLQTFLGNEKGNYVFGDLMFYYEEGNPRKFVAPDLMVCLNKEIPPSTGVYKLWLEKSVPNVVIEIASASTWDKDLTVKFALFERLGVSEYYIFDVEYKCLREPLMAFRLIDFVYEKVEIENNRVFSQALNLELVDTGETLRLFNPNTNEFLMTQQELDSKQQYLEAENIKLRAEIEKLKQTK